MIRLNEGAEQNEMLHFIRNWVMSLSHEEYEKAIEIIDNEQNEDFQWDAPKLKDVFMEYTWQERMPKINNPYQMDLSKERVYYYHLEDGSGWFVEYDMPMDGEWGDLTAQFYFKRIENEFTVILHDIHVL